MVRRPVKGLGKKKEVIVNSIPKVEPPKVDNFDYDYAKDKYHDFLNLGDRCQLTCLNCNNYINIEKANFVCHLCKTKL